MRRASYLRNAWYALGQGNVDGVISTHEMHDRAKAYLPRAVYDAVAGGAGDELTIAAHRDAFSHVWLRPRTCADVSTRDLSTTVLGDRISMPLFLDPCGFSRM